MFSATHIGRDHLRVLRNNQDGHFASRDAIVVTDGCSSQPQSEVGAQLGARFLGEWLSAQTTVNADLPERAMASLCDWLRSTSGQLGSAAHVLERYFLFTFLAAVRREGRVVVFGAGDGAFLVDDQLVRLDPGPDNAPNYCAYRLTGDGRPAELHFLGEAHQVAVMTDGLDALDPVRLRALVQPEGLERNPLTLQRRLNVLAETERFGDDATLAVLGAP